MSELAVAEWCLPVRGVEAIHLCVEQNIGAMQIDFGGPGRSIQLDYGNYYQKVLDALKKYKVAINAVACNQFNDFGLGMRLTDVRMTKIKKIIISVLNCAQAFSAPLVFFPSYHSSMICDQEALIRTAILLRFASQEGAARGIVIANENSLPIRWAKKLIREIDSKNFRLVFDTYNLLSSGQSVLEYLREMKEHLASQVHIKDGWKGEPGHVRMGSGDGNVKEFLSLLSKHGWIKQLVLENNYRSSDFLRLTYDFCWTKNLMNLKNI